MTVGGAQRNNPNRDNRGDKNAGKGGKGGNARPGGKGSNANRKNPAAAARAVSAARGTSRDLTKIIIGVVVVAVIAAAVVIGVIYEQHKSSEAAQTVIPVKTVTDVTKYPAVLDKADATVLVGQPTAKITLDLYEDFLCPICGEFESSNFDNIAQQLALGHIKVNYHLLNLLDNDSTPAGYSSMAANTALAVATVDPQQFLNFHYSLYGKQPQEQGPGWTQAQLTSVANRLGVNGPAFDNLINSKTYYSQINKNMLAANGDKALYETSSSGTGFGTPTVVVNGKTLINSQEWGAGVDWLNNLIKTDYPAS
jgi:protein-disulfide isomerase